MLGNGNYHFEFGRNHLATLSLFYDGIEEPLRKLMARVLRKWDSGDLWVRPNFSVVRRPVQNWAQQI